MPQRSFCIKGNEIIHALAHTDKLHRELQLVCNSEYHATLCRTVELCEDDAGDARELKELLCLLQTVLAGGGIEHHQGLHIRVRVRVTRPG